MSVRSKNAKNQKLEYAKALQELSAIRGSLDAAYDKFDGITDPQVMDACIFEISALKSRYNCAIINLKSFF